MKFPKKLIVNPDFFNKDKHTDTYLKAIKPANIKVIVDVLTALIKGTKVKFDAIAFQGNSGALISPLVAMKLNKQLILIRKNEIDSHSYKILEGYKESRNYIIIDDTISSGETISNIVEQIGNESCYNINPPKCNGIFLYNENAALFNFRKDNIPVYFFNIDDKKKKIIININDNMTYKIPIVERSNYI